MKNIKFIFIAIISLSLAYSCSNFEEINTNPDKPTSVAPDMLATQVLKNSFRFWNVNASDFTSGNLFNKHIAMLETNPNPGQYYYSYYPYGSLGAYSRLTDLKRMTEFAEGSPNEASYKGLALFLKAYYGFNSTIDMGDVPYSEAGMAEEGITRPKYDKQEDVIVQVLEDLKLAEAYFAEGKNFDGDIMFGGDATRWRKLCNAMQLKVIQTISKKATSDQKSRFAAIVSAGNLMTSNSDDFKLEFSTNPNAVYPFYNGGDARQLYTGVTELVINNLKNWNDRRLFYFAEPSQQQIDLGKSASDFDAYVGAPSALAADQLALNNQSGVYSLINLRYQTYMDGDPMLYFTYSEQCFIIAEAIEEGWLSGNSQTYYENGVKATLEYYKDLPNTAPHVHGMAIDQGYIDGYFTGAAAYATY